MKLVYNFNEVAFSSGERIATTEGGLNNHCQVYRSIMKSSLIAGVTNDVEPLERSIEKLSAKRYPK